MNQKETRPDEKSFAELLAESSMKSEHLKPGERVEAEVVNITPDWVYLNMDGKTEGYLSSEEVRDETGNIPLKEGDRISVYFLEAKNGERHFTTRVRGPEAARSFLEQAWQNKTVVEGTVEKAIKGGFLVKLIGGIRGFCPLSQVETARLENPEEYIGRKLDFIVIGYEKKGRNIVLSHRAVLEQEIERKRQALREELREGMTVRGTITSIQKFGAFVDLGGIEGLIPASEVSWSPVEDLHSVLTEGQETEAVVIRLDWDKGRITLSLKEALPGPWTNIEEKYPDGSVHTGQVARLTPFGAFVTLEPGIDGLIRFARKKEGEKPPPL
ncbi:MAG: S1 RNA-binding domain-containing protein, partial [Syntrophales bacterium]|nr:S1 RNA-binding domain-containing protein [Syntrophales bacterium]